MANRHLHGFEAKLLMTRAKVNFKPGSVSRAFRRAAVAATPAPRPLLQTPLVKVEALASVVPQAWSAQQVNVRMWPCRPYGINSLSRVIRTWPKDRAVAAMMRSAGSAGAVPGKKAEPMRMSVLSESRRTPGATRQCSAQANVRMW